MRQVYGVATAERTVIDGASSTGGGLSGLVCESRSHGGCLAPPPIHARLGIAEIDLDPVAVTAAKCAMFAARVLVMDERREARTAW